MHTLTRLLFDAALLSLIVAMSLALYGAFELMHAAAKNRKPWWGK